jgi:hypothetical protein
MSKKIFAVAGSIATASLLAAALVASAQTTTVAPASTVANPSQVLNIGEKGNVLLRGTIASISHGTITVNSWGGVWTINIPSSASIYPVGTTDYTTQFQVGDFVGLEGTVSTSANWTINATFVRDWTYRATLTTQEKANAQAARAIQQGAPRDYVGTASNIGASSLTLTAANGTVYTVNPNSNAELVNRNWITLPFASIQSGDNIRVYGVNASGTIAAQIVRDVSIPAK